MHEKDSFVLLGYVLLEYWFFFYPLVFNILLNMHGWSLNIILQYFSRDGDCLWFIFEVIGLVSGWGGTSSFSVAWSYTKCCWRCILLFSPNMYNRCLFKWCTIMLILSVASILMNVECHRIDMIKNLNHLGD
jgi:hypothetical protein